MILINSAYDSHKEDVSLQINPDLNHQPEDSSYFPLLQKKQISIPIQNFNLLQLHMAEQKVMTF